LKEKEAVMFCEFLEVGAPHLQTGDSMPQPRKQHRVFVVHDEFVIASSLAAMLRQQGFEARSFTDPHKALSAAASEAPELLISEFAMPLLSGSELASQVRQCSPDCKVLLFSAQRMNRISGEHDRNGQRFQILTMLRHPPDSSMIVKAENELAY
jgi:PleD family two-component response regulator